jgi:diaminohydroxyphosphoribosylaminopyrimidine deaminase/5-amino-6-(5-phosphoribosylamino)uracil reductase
MSNNQDMAFLEMAYSLAEKAKGWANPNPYVGAVVAKKGAIIGTGYHKKPGKPHAEAIALQRAGSQAKGSTVYITLEPCVHWGRTPPCVDHLIRSEIKRAVISSYDPNPIVCQKGIQKMREAGIDVSVGLLQEKNAALNEVYNKYIRSRIPFLTAKVAASLDGKMATGSRQSHWITSRPTRQYVHLLRGEHEAIMVGINTILQDNPRLTIRHPLWKKKRILRVIIDSQLRFSAGAKILETLERGKILIFTCRSSLSKKAEALKKRGVEVVSLPGNPDGRVDLKKVLIWMGQKEISSVMVEGGSQLLTSLLEQKLIDKIYITLSSKLIGGAKALTFFEGEGFSSITSALRVKKTKCHQLGEDFILEGYL